MTLGWKAAIGVGVVVGIVALSAFIVIERRSTGRWHQTNVDPGPALTPAVGPVVENPAPDPTTPAFRISPRPTMVVGRLRDNDLRNELWAIRDAVLTERGKLAVINPADEVRLFDQAGRIVWAKRGRGAGPGDIIGGAALASFAGDTVLVLDVNLRRVTTFDERGGAVRTASVSSSGSICCLRDGSLLVPAPGQRDYRPLATIPEHVTWFVQAPGRRSAVAAAPGRMSESERERPRPRPDGRELFTVRASDPVISVGPLNERMPPRPGVGSSTLMMTSRARPFARSTFIRPAGHFIVYGRTDAYEYRVYSPTGEVLRVVRSSLPAVPVTSEDIERGRARFMDVPYSDAAKRVYASVFEMLEHPTTMPAYGRLLAEDDGSVWIESYAATPGDATWWARFDPAGKLLGTLTIPAALRVVRFSRGHVLVRSPEDSDGFVELRVHAIEPNPGQ